ncbi:MAG: ketopantoate reductase family protein [Solirubrobacteraceae bacterium]
MIAVLGPGGVGGLLAAALARAGEPVLLVAREQTAALIAREGIDVRSVALGDFHAAPAVATRLDRQVDALLVATKAAGLDAALERVEVSPKLVLPLLNGLDHLAVLRARFGEGRVLGATIRVGSDLPVPAQTVQNRSFLRIEIAAGDADTGPLAASLERAGVQVVVGASEARVMWGKLVRLNALACTTSASGLLLGEIRSDPHWRAQLLGAIEEAAAVARAEGAAIEPANVWAEFEQAHATLGSSMARDIAAGREPELDAIPGAVLRAAARHDIDCPVVEALVRDIVSSLN